jgi:hypothetical protein
MLLGMMAARLLAQLASEFVFASFHGRESRGGNGNPAGEEISRSQVGWSMAHGASSLVC